MVLVGSIGTLIHYSISHMGVWSFEFISIIILYSKVLFVPCQSGVSVILKPVMYGLHLQWATDPYGINVFAISVTDWMLYNMKC